MIPRYNNVLQEECFYPPCTNSKSESGGKLRACAGCSVAGKGMAVYCSTQCQKSDWPRHKPQCKQRRQERSALPAVASKTIDDLVVWDRKHRAKLIAAAISALDLCHYPENADEYLFVVALVDTPGAKHRFTIRHANAISFDVYEELFGGAKIAGYPREDQRIGQERAKEKGGPAAISFQIVEFALANACRNTFQTPMLPRELHGYRTAGFVTTNWEEVLLASCAWPRVPVPENRSLYRRWNVNLDMLKAWRDMHMDEIYAAAIAALSLAEYPENGQHQFLLLYLRSTGIPAASELVHVVNAFVYDVEVADVMFNDLLLASLKSVVNGRPATDIRGAADPAPCVVCQMVDPVDSPTKAPAFTIRVQPTEALLGQTRQYGWKERLIENLGAGDVRPNMVELDRAMNELFLHTSMPEPVTSLHLPKELYEELGASIRGEVYLRNAPEFVEYSSIFNGNVVCVAKAVACPLDAEDVSKIILFCSKHSLSPSVKAGGYGTGGWAIGVIDLSKLVDIHIETPQPDGGYTSLRAQDAANKLKDNGPSGKRRREEDTALRFYDSASQAVADFLRGPHQPGWDMPQPVRRRLEEPASRSRHLSMSSGESDSASEESHNATEEGSTDVTSPSRSPPPSGSHPPRASRPVTGGDPFGYLDNTRKTEAAPPTVVQSNPPRHNDRWATSGRVITNSNLPPVPLNLVAQARPIYPHAYVTFGAGMRQKEVDVFSAKHPLEAQSLTAGPNVTIPYHIPFAAHPAGSGVMLLGGFGFLSRLHGLSSDNLVEVEMVLADGRIVIVNKDEHPDLWWGLRGAGPALGIVTRYKAKAFPIPVVFAGNLLYRFHRATAPSLIKHFRDCVKSAPRELYANVLLTAGPEGKDSLIVVQMCFVGPKEKGQEYLLALSSWDGERCLLNEVHEKDFLHQQDSVAQVLRGKPGRQWYIRSALITSLPDEIINQTVLQFAGTPVGCTWLFELAGGALVDYEDTCVPKSQREASFNITALHQWEMSIDDARCIDSAEEWIRDSLKSVQSGGPFPSFLGRHEPADRVMRCYGDNWARLVEIKKKYDPNNVFSNSLWPLGRDFEPVDPRTHEPPTPPHLKFGH
ncbi:FAD-binding PCMH-type domain-containing protein [Mycena chlorophos]|uniref:FAD-binding PCMH-type domain-containing protein n=1 Tax=Mycena chlorophos TaxID=658473 RepID=A0A8H6VQA1_MYCCL|nr:FAD-binding PCMH-type domain-containing protein [Mycena chlorophos]